MIKAYKTFDGKTEDGKYFTKPGDGSVHYFQAGKVYKHDGDLIPCHAGYHFHRNMNEVFTYKETRVAVVCEIEVTGSVVDDTKKSVASEFSIVKELTRTDLNTGVDNTGVFNSGNRNSGDCNSGNRNSGDCNSGYRNSGNRNSGDCNSGNRNSGNRNSGDWNSGNRNSGNRNSGDCNSSNRNSGYRNSGNRNSGDWNSGYRNSGYRNSGDWNSGNWNSGNRNSGFFNSETPEDILVFNKPCRVEKWKNAYKPEFLNFDLTKWVGFSDMTNEEKANNPDAEITGGYLKTMDYKEAFRESWKEADPEDRIRVKELPNFDRDVFYEISGIDVDKD